MTDTFRDGHYQHTPTAILAEHPSWAYLLGMGPVREPTEAEQQHYDELAKEPWYAELIDIAARANAGESIPTLVPLPEPTPLDDEEPREVWTEAEVDAALADDAQRSADQSLERWVKPVRNAGPSAEAEPATETVTGIITHRKRAS